MPNPRTQPFLQLQNISFAYDLGGEWTLNVAELALDIGEIIAIIGPNGSGKSTLLKLAAGVETPHQGEIKLGSVDLQSLDRRNIARRLGYLPQRVAPYFDYEVEQVVGMGRFPHLTGIGMLRGEDREAVQQAMADTEVDALAQRPLSQLSGGERQRVYLAAALAQDPKLLLLDEPTTSLDAHHQVAFFALLRKLAASGMGVAVVTHDLNLASLFAQRIFLMQSGRVIAEGTPEEVIRREHLETAYGPELIIESHPQAGKPVVLPALHEASTDEANT